MGRNSLSRPSTRSASIQSRAEGRIFCVSGAYLPGKAARSRNRNRRPRGSAIKDSSQSRQGRPGLLEEYNQTHDRSSPNVEFVGEIGERDKGEFLGNADALLFPIDWPEPFGLVMIEAMACGTPVIAFRRGSAPEVIDDGVSGFLVDDVPQATAAVRRVAELDRAHARAAFERRFDIERVAHKYVQIYRGLVRAEENLRDGKRNGVKQSLIPRAQRDYRPILGQLGAEVSNATQVD